MSGLPLIGVITSAASNGDPGLALISIAGALILTAGAFYVLAWTD